MKEITKSMIIDTVMSIGGALAIFCLTGIVFDIAYGGNFSLDHYRFTKMVIGCIVVGLGFGLPSVVYQKDNLPMPIRVLIHMGIGCVVYTIVAYAVGWLGGAQSVFQGIIIAAIQIGVAFILRALFMCYYRKEAERMNKRIQQMK